MAIGHVAVRTHNRCRRHTAAAALAYRAGERLRDRVGCVHDYRRRGRTEAIRDCGVSAPKRWAGSQDLQVLADTIEVAEKRKDSRLLRDFQVALPCELSRDQQITLARDFSNLLTDRYDTPVAWAVHQPAEGEDERNIHAHLVVPTRSLNEAGDAFGAKLRLLDCPRTASEEITKVRNRWADLANAALIQAGKHERVNVGRNSKKGHRRYAKPARPAKPGFRGRASALLRDFRQLLAIARDDWVFGIRMSMRKYFKNANVQVRVAAKPPAAIEPSPQADLEPLTDGVFDSFVRYQRAADAYRRRQRKEGMKASPMLIEIRRAHYECGAAIENPPTTIALGQSIDVTTKGRDLYTAVITSILEDKADFALVRTRQHETVLLRAQYADQPVFEIKRQADGTITASKAGPIGRVVDGQFVLNHNRVGKALARFLGRSSLSIDEFTRQMSAALQVDGAQILHTATPPRTDTDVSPGVAKIFGYSRLHSVDTLEGYDAAWAAASLHETFSQQQEVREDAPSSLNADSHREAGSKP